MDKTKTTTTTFDSGFSDLFLYFCFHPVLRQSFDERFPLLTVSVCLLLQIRGKGDTKYETPEDR